MSCVIHWEMESAEGSSQAASTERLQPLAHLPGTSRRVRTRTRSPVVDLLLGWWLPRFEAPPEWLALSQVASCLMSNSRVRLQFSCRRDAVLLAVLSGRTVRAQTRIGCVLDMHIRSRCTHGITRLCLVDGLRCQAAVVVLFVCFLPLPWGPEIDVSNIAVSVAELPTAWPQGT